MEAGGESGSGRVLTRRADDPVRLRDLRPLVQSVRRLHKGPLSALPRRRGADRRRIGIHQPGLGQQAPVATGPWAAPRANCREPASDSTLPLRSREKTILGRCCDRRGIHFPLLSDPESKIIRAYGLLNETAPKGPFYGIPYPGTFVLDARGVVVAKYFEDVDLCLRMARAGWQVMFNGDTYCYHGEERASLKVFSRDGMRHLRSYYHWLRKWGWFPEKKINRPTAA